MVDREFYMEKLQFIHKQTQQMMDANGPFVRCGCHKKLAPHQAYRCLYCGQWYCKPCAEEHFGETVEDYRKTKPLPEGIQQDHIERAHQPQAEREGI